MFMNVDPGAMENPTYKQHLPLDHLYSVLKAYDRSLLWCEVPVYPLNIPLQSAVILLTRGKIIICRDLLPCLVVGERKWNRVLVLKEALQVSLGQLGGIVQSVGVEERLLFFWIAFPECELQVADFGATVSTAGTQEAHEDRDNDDTPAQDLWTYKNDMMTWNLRTHILCLNKYR